MFCASGGNEAGVSRSWSGLVLLAAGLACAGCGAATTAPADTARAYVQAWTAQDGAAVCALLAPETKAEVEQSAQTPCAQGVLDEDLPDAGPVRRTEVWGDQAMVRLQGDTLFVAEFPDGWHITAAGCRSRGERPYDCQLQGG
jgi:hypothetical protein